MDAILLFGAGFDDKGLSELSRRRADAVIAMKPKCYVICLAAYTVHKKPYLDEKGFPLIEARVFADYLVAHGIPKKQILLEPFSLDTIGSAFLARIMHTDPKRLRSLRIVASDFHMPRVKAICEWIFHLKPSPRYKLEFVSVSDEGISDDMLAPRRLREMKSTQNIMAMRKHIKTIQQFVKWLFSEHQAYAYGLTIKEVSAEEKKSY